VKLEVWSKTRRCELPGKALDLMREVSTYCYEWSPPVCNLTPLNNLHFRFLFMRKDSAACGIKQLHVLSCLHLPSLQHGEGTSCLM
jgi:hypothetical protein